MNPGLSLNTYSRLWVLMVMVSTKCLCCIFFFSSRRRHTRSKRDWSSDVCSSDLALSTWLYRIAVNTVLMHFRKKALRQISLDEPYNQDARLVRREYGSRDGRLAGSVDRIALTRAIKELPVGYRTIFLLHEVEGYEHQEIAELLDCSVGNSKSQLHTAKLR